MKIKSFLAALAFTLLLSIPVSAQRYHTGLGVRLGSFSGITAKHFISNQNALEGLLSFRWDGLVITGLYEWQNPVKNVEGLDWVIGGGAHIGFWNSDAYYWTKTGGGSYTIVGLDFILGLEYTFTQAPFTLGLDWKPAINVVGDNHWWGDGAALSIRYNFN